MTGHVINCAEKNKGTKKGDGDIYNKEPSGAGEPQAAAAEGKAKAGKPKEGRCRRAIYGRYRSGSDMVSGRVRFLRSGLAGLKGRCYEKIFAKTAWSDRVRAGNRALLSVCYKF